MEASYDIAREVIEMDKLEEGNTSTAEGKQDWLSWAVPNSGLKLKNQNWKNGKWKTKNEKWKTENEKRKMKNENQKMKNRKWKTKNEKWKTNNEKF